MFEFLTKKYKRRINDLESQIDNILYEWNDERKLYDDQMQQKRLEQKVDYVIGGIDMTKHKEIHRPIYGLSREEAFKVAGMVKHELEKQNILVSTSFHWRARECCYVIDVQVIPKHIQEK